MAFIFPLWDVLFGTYYHPCPTEYPETGLASGDQVMTLWQASARSFLRWNRAQQRSFAGSVEKQF